MRRFLSLVLVALMITGLCACDLDTIQETQPSTTVVTTAPTEKPTESLTEAPTIIPTDAPTEAPTVAPTVKPTAAPTQVPTAAPTQKPTEVPTAAPTVKPTIAPTNKPTVAPTQEPTDPPHTHNWKSASCENPQTCTECGATLGSAVGHDFTNGSCTKCGVSDPNYTNDIMVWIPTKGGKKYHTRKDCSNMDNPDYVTQEEAEKLGFTPCKRCH